MYKYFLENKKYIEKLFTYQEIKTKSKNIKKLLSEKVSLFSNILFEFILNKNRINNII